jgi:hypothetical protein
MFKVHYIHVWKYNETDYFVQNTLVNNLAFAEMIKLTLILGKFGHGWIGCLLCQNPNRDGKWTSSK